MRKFVFLIADEAMFPHGPKELGTALGNIIADYYVQHNTLPEESFVDEALEAMGISCYRFSIPHFTPIENAPAIHLNTVEDIAFQAGRGLAFGDQWSTYSSVYLLLED